MTAAKQPVPFVERVRIENFRSIESCNVELSPLTVLVGLNAAGKSNFLDALRFVVDALGNGIQAAVRNRSGVTAVWRERSTDKPLLIELSLRLADKHGDPVGHAAVYGFKLGYTENLRQPVVVLDEWFRVANRDGSQVNQNIGDIFVPQSGMSNFAPNQPELPLRSYAGHDKSAQRLYTALLGMSFYTFDPEAIRDITPADNGTSLELHGRNLGDVLDRISSGWPVIKKRLDAYLASIVPGALSVDCLKLGSGYTGVQLSMKDLETGELQRFRPESVSDGTLRAAAVLAALFQPDSLAGYATTVCIDEPELGLHPSAAGMLFYALIEASEHVQVIVATQSGDLLHRDEINLDWIRPVVMRDGRTIIGPVDAVTREIVEQKLATVGERMRLDQILPAGLEGEE